jgi:hypothetical protein
MSERARTSGVHIGRIRDVAAVLRLLDELDGWLGVGGELSTDDVLAALELARGAGADLAVVPLLESIDDLRAGIDDLRERTTAEGRDPGALAVAIGGGADVAGAVADPDSFRARVASYEVIGVTHVMVGSGHDREPAALADDIAAFGETFCR